MLGTKLLILMAKLSELVVHELDGGGFADAAAVARFRFAGFQSELRFEALFLLVDHVA